MFITTGLVRQVVPGTKHILKPLLRGIKNVYNYKHRI